MAGCERREGLDADAVLVGNFDGLSGLRVRVLTWTFSKAGRRNTARLQMVTIWGWRNLEQELSRCLPARPIPLVCGWRCAQPGTTLHKLLCRGQPIDRLRHPRPLSSDSGPMPRPLSSHAPKHAAVLSKLCYVSSDIRRLISRYCELSASRITGSIYHVLSFLMLKQSLFGLG